MMPKRLVREGESMIKVQSTSTPAHQFSCHDPIGLYCLKHGFLGNFLLGCVRVEYGAWAKEDGLSNVRKERDVGAEGNDGLGETFHALQGRGNHPRVGLKLDPGIEGASLRLMKALLEGPLHPWHIPHHADRHGSFRGWSQHIGRNAAVDLANVDRARPQELAPAKIGGQEPR